MGQNLDDSLLVQMLYNDKMNDNVERSLANHQLCSRVRLNSQHRVSEYTDLLNEWLEDEYGECSLAEIKYEVYNALHCVYVNIKNPEKKLTMKARANPRWAHRRENKIYDFVVIEQEDGNLRAGLEAVSIAQLRLLLRIHGPDKGVKEVAIVQVCERVLNDLMLPCYRRIEGLHIVETFRIPRTVHMIPRWETRVIDLCTGPGREANIYEQYSEMVMNTHSDAAAWNRYS